MASVTKNVEFENVIFDIPVSSDDVHFSKSADTTIQEPPANDHKGSNTSNPDPPHYDTNHQPNIENLQLQTNTTTRNRTWSSKLMSTASPLKNYNVNKFKIFLKAVVFLACLGIIIYLGVLMHLNRSRPIKCQACGKPLKYPTFLGNLIGNQCEGGSLGYPDYDCGEQAAACFKMDVVHSEEWKEKAKALYDWYVGEDSHHPFSLDPYLFEGTIRGCIHGFVEPSSNKSCHFFNSSYVGHNIDIDGTGWHNNHTWITTTTCVCATDNCN